MCVFFGFRKIVSGVFRPAFGHGIDQGDELTQKQQEQQQQQQRRRLLRRGSICYGNDNLRWTKKTRTSLCSHSLFRSEHYCYTIATMCPRNETTFVSLPVSLSLRIFFLSIGLCLLSSSLFFSALPSIVSYFRHCLSLDQTDYRFPPCII